MDLSSYLVNPADGRTNRPRSPPPPYTPRNICSDAQQQVAAERLRRFLAHCLAVDYGLEAEVPDQLRQDDWAHFIGISTTLYYVQKVRHPSAYPTFELPLDCRSTYANGELFDHCSALGIPREAALCMLRLNICGTKLFSCRTVSAIEIIAKRYGMHTLAWKLCLDRDLLIDALLPARYSTFRERMMTRNEGVSLRYFEHLSGMNDYQLSTYGATHLANAHDDTNSLRGFIAEVRLAASYVRINALELSFAMFESPLMDLGGLYVKWRQKAMFGPRSQDKMGMDNSGG